MSECNLLRTPMEARLKLVKDGKEEEGNPSQFRSFIRSLRYLINTRPDITYNVNYLRRYMNEPSSEHMSALITCKERANEDAYLQHNSHIMVKISHLFSNYHLIL